MTSAARARFRLTELGSALAVILAAPVNVKSFT